MDFEKIRLETVKEFEDKLVKTDDYANKLASSFIDLSSKISKQMLIKYHEKLNSK
jgi:hypothetical protein